MSLQSSKKAPPQQQPPPVYRRSEPRLKLFYWVFGVIFIFLSSGLAWRQIVEGPRYNREQAQQSLRRVLLPGTRGNLYDRHGVLLVGNRPVFSAVIYLGELRQRFREEYTERLKLLKAAKKPINRLELRRESRAFVLQRYLNELNRILGKRERIEPEDLDRHFSQRLLLPYTLLKDLSPEEYAKLIEKLPAHSPIQIYVDNARYYPYHSAAAHALGYVGSTLDINEAGVPGQDLTTFSLRGKVGKAGLEKSLDSRLQGTSGGEIWQVDPAGLQGKLIEKKFPTQGESVTTSLDIHLQLIAETALGERRGAIVAIEVGTGEVLAMVSKPAYDLNELSPYIPTSTYARINEAGAWLNRATQGLYPPGSPFKLITATAGLRAGVIDDHTHVECVGTHRVGNRLFPCMRRWGHGKLDITGAIGHSCNPFFYVSSIQTGVELLAAEARGFGLGRKTGIELPYETAGTVVPDPAWKKSRKFGPWTAGDTANMSIGQGYLLVTPLQMACVAESLARGQHTPLTPTLLHNPLTPREPITRPARPLDLEHWQYSLILQGMEKATQTGTSKSGAIPGIRIAAKTGTAQTYKQGKERDLAWWIGFAPIEDPKIALAIMIEETTDDERYGGGSTASPVAQAMIRQYLQH